MSAHDALMIIGYRLCITLLIQLLLGLSAFQASSQQMTTTDRRHFASPPSSLPSGDLQHRMRTTEAQRWSIRLGDYMTTFQDGTEADAKASHDCATGTLRMRRQGRYMARFIDRTVEAGTSRTVIDPNRRLLPDTLYAFTNPGSTSCVVWRITQ